MSIRRSVLLALLLLVLLGTSSAVYRQRIKFSGYDWYIRESKEPEGPMNNYFAGLGESIDVLPDGGMRLSLSYNNGIWCSAEIWTLKSLGYGTYTFHIRTPLALLHPDLVLGFFTYSQTVWYHNREIDIEFSSWGSKERSATPSGQFVVQPYERDGHLAAFSAAPLKGPSTQQFVWTKSRIDFASWLGYGDRPPAGDARLVSEWSFTDAKLIPKPSAPLHINLYLMNGQFHSEKDGSIVVIIDSFSFTPER